MSWMGNEWEKRDAIMALRRGVPSNMARTFSNGSRAGKRSGYAVEMIDGVLRIVRYGVASRVGGIPSGERRDVISDETIKYWEQMMRECPREGYEID